MCFAWVFFSCFGHYYCQNWKSRSTFWRRQKELYLPSEAQPRNKESSQITSSHFQLRLCKQVPGTILLENKVWSQAILWNTCLPPGPTIPEKYWREFPGKGQGLYRNITFATSCNPSKATVKKSFLRYKPIRTRTGEKHRNESLKMESRYLSGQRPTPWTPKLAVGKAEKQQDIHHRTLQNSEICGTRCLWKSGIQMSPNTKGLVGRPSGLTTPHHD